MKMNFKRLEPKSKKTKSIIFFMHGYGADGADLLSIGNVLGEHLPNTLFIAPDAPTKCKMSAVGFQWFPIPGLDGSSEDKAMKELEEISSYTNRWIDDFINTENVVDSNVFLFGFSQGTMLSLYMGPQRKNSLGGIIGFSGKLMNINVFKERVYSRPPILLIHGDQDEVVSPLCLSDAYNELNSLNFNVKKHLSAGVGHGIAPDGLSEAINFLKNKGL